MSENPAVRNERSDPHTSEGGTLKPCPFCGGAATFLIQPEQQQRDNGDRVTCTGPLKCPGHRVYATVDDWNRRSAPAAGMVMVPRDLFDAARVMLRVAGETGVDAKLDNGEPTPNSKLLLDIADTFDAAAREAK